MVKTVESEFLGSNFDSAVYQQHDLGKIISLYPNVWIIIKVNNGTYFIGLFWGLNELIYIYKTAVPGTL